MAKNALFLFSLKTTRGSGFDVGDVVICYWDDVANAIVVELSNGFADPSPATVTSGPSLGLTGSDHFVQDYAYKFCNGTTFTYFQYNAGVFPYAIKAELPNSPYCSFVPVCDLNINDNPATVAASNISTNNGSITVSATSSYGPIKFGLTDFNYATEGQASGLFTNLFAGNYTIYAKDANGCIDTISVTVPLSQTYALRYKSEWKALISKPNPVSVNHKIEIYERGYSGSVEVLLADADPYTRKLNSDAEDKFYVIRSNSITFRFITTVDFKYQNLFTEDDRQYLVKHYVDYGSGYEIDFIGYEIPFLYQEEYIKDPYTITIEATDGLANLKDLDFVDASNNNFKGYLSGLQIVTTILKKLNIDINVQSALNIYETNFATSASDDPLAQALYDTTVYYTKGQTTKCDVVLKNILMEYGAVLSQSDGKWIIWRPEELIGSFDYREYTLDAVYVSDGSIDPEVRMSHARDSNCLVIADQSGNLELLPSYGTFIVKQNLIVNPSVLPSYSFEEEDLVPFGLSNTKFFRGWNIAINTGSPTWGLERIDSENECFYVKFPGYQFSEVVLYTTESSYLSWSSNDQLAFGFDFLIGSVLAREWNRISYKIKVGSYWYSGNTDFLVGNWTIDDYGYNQLITTSKNKFDKLLLQFKNGLFGEVVEAPPAVSGDDQQVQFYFTLNNGNKEDFSTLASFKAWPTVGKRLGIQKIVKDGSVYRFYILEWGEITGVNPDFVAPDDYSLISNLAYWRQTSTMKDLTNINGAYILIDNVIAKVLPDGSEPPSSISYEIVVNPNNKRTLEVEINHGDCPTSISNAKYAYKNYIRRYNGSSYVPTSFWKRDMFPESLSIQKILLTTLIAQFKKSSRRLSTNLIGDKYLKPYSVLREGSDGNRRYLAQGFEQKAKVHEYSVDAYELKDATDPTEIVHPFSGAFDPQQFGIDYD